MKHIFITTTFCIGFLLAGKNVNAQNNPAPAVKIATEENDLKPAAESAKFAGVKQEQSKAPVMPAFQKSAVPQQTAGVAAPEADITKDVKAIEIKADSQKGQKIQNADRPKTSTIEPVKKAEPATKPMPLAAPAIEG